MNGLDFRRQFVIPPPSPPQLRLIIGTSQQLQLAVQFSYSPYIFWAIMNYNDK